MVDLSKVRTYPIQRRHNLVASLPKIERLQEPINTPDLIELSQRIKTARQNNHPVMLMMGGHVIKTGCSPYIIDLLKKGIITHVATNGSGSIHDFELALIAGTSEDVAKSIEDGSFGMVEETGSYMNEAINQDPKKGYGYQIGKMIDERNLPYKEISIAYSCYKLNIPFTVHAAIGTDTIHQHPKADGAKIGEASFTDFKKYIDTVAQGEGGCFLNFGSAVIMPEVFLKALSIARNLGNVVDHITTANFDQISHYRPKVNIVERPTSKGGKGFTFIGTHQKLMPSLYQLLVD